MVFEKVGGQTECVCVLRYDDDNKMESNYIKRGFKTDSSLRITNAVNLSDDDDDVSVRQLRVTM